jgi:hypothetical protein
MPADNKHAATNAFAAAVEDNPELIGRLQRLMSRDGNAELSTTIVVMTTSNDPDVSAAAMIRHNGSTVVGMSNPRKQSEINRFADPSHLYAHMSKQAATQVLQKWGGA